jgi:hypothetical protein
MIALYYLSGLLSGVALKSIYDKKDKICRLYRAIHEYTPNVLVSIYKTIVSILAIQWDTLIAVYIRRLKTPRKLPNNLLEVDYYHNDAKFSIRVKDRGVFNDIQEHITVFDENSNNISTVFYRYLGPGYDFHGHQYTPEMMGFTKITIVDSHMKMTTFNTRDVIVVN